MEQSSSNSDDGQTPEIQQQVAENISESSSASRKENDSKESGPVSQLAERNMNSNENIEDTTSNVEGKSPVNGEDVKARNGNDNQSKTDGNNNEIDLEDIAAMDPELRQVLHHISLENYFYNNTKHPHKPRSNADLAKFILSDDCQSIVILAGAGMSRASGIPDFRSAGGLYESLKPEQLTATPIEQEMIRLDSTEVFDKGLFLENPLPCLEVMKSFILGTEEQKWKATLAHRFVELLHRKTGKLTRLYTQNIDGLEGQCKNLPREKVIAVHGKMHYAACENCNAEMDYRDFCDEVRTKIKDISEKDPSAPSSSSPINCPKCDQAAMKPTIVLFRSPLPQEFFVNVPNDLPNADLLIVIGTSLCVGPANSLVYRVPLTALRVVVNAEEVGHMLGIQYDEDAPRDYFAQGYSEEVICDLMGHLGWLDDIKQVSETLPEESKELVKAAQQRDKKASCDCDEKVESTTKAVNKEIVDS